MTLAGPRPRTDQTYVNFGKGTGQSNELRRIKAEPAVRKEIRKRVQHGMTLVTANDSLSQNKRRTGDFMIIDSLY